MTQAYLIVYEKNRSLPCHLGRSRCHTAKKQEERPS